MPGLDGQVNMRTGQAVTLPGRGTTWIYDSGAPAESNHNGSAPPERPVLLLLHGWTSTAAMNWFRCFPALAAEYRVVALDHRGHGRGIRSRAPFRLEDCADDAAALLDQLGVAPAIVVGYSMGGPIAQLLWRRHRDAVGGLVLCATAASFRTRQEFAGRLGAISLGASVALSLVPSNVRRQGMTIATRNWSSNLGVAPWIVEEWQRHDPSALIQGGLALGRFDSSSWIGEVDVPTAVVVTAVDGIVSPRRQWRLAQSVPEAVAFPVQADHRACVEQASLFVPALLAACRSVARRTSTGNPVAEPTA